MPKENLPQPSEQALIERGRQDGMFPLLQFLAERGYYFDCESSSCEEAVRYIACLNACDGVSIEILEEVARIRALPDLSWIKTTDMKATKTTTCLAHAMDRAVSP